MWQRITNIWRKELMDNLRDRKALQQTLLVPLFIGIFYAVFNPLLTAGVMRRSEETLRLPTQGIEHATEALIETFGQFDIELVDADGGLEGRIQRAEIVAGMVIPEGFAAAVAAEQPASLVLLINPTSGGIFGGQISLPRLRLAIESYNSQQAVQRITERNIPPEVLNPVALETRDLSSPEQQAGLFAAFSLPFVIAFLVIQGGLYIAIDVTAGEKERGTLESLLVTPASDVEVLIGKLAAVFSMSLVPLLLTLLGYYVASNLLPEDVTQGAVLPFSAVLGAVVVGIPLTLFANVVLLNVAVRTKAFKDAQSAATSLSFLFIIPAFAVAFLPPSNLAAYLVPIYGPSAAVAAISSGGVVPEGAIVLSIVSSLLAAAVGFAVATRRFNRERMLYSA